jgi:hypothetical protein
VLALVGMGTLLVGRSLDGALAVVPIATGAAILLGCLLIYAFARTKGEECKLFSYWRGVHPLNSTDDFEGFGVLTFPRQTAPLREGVGFFSDTVNGRVENTLKKSFVMSRCMPDGVM